MSISNLIRSGIVSCVLVILSGCATMVTKEQKFPRMYEEKPLTIFVLPPINSTTAADAKEYYSTTITEPLAYAGFYVFPMEVTGDILKSQGLYDTELIINQPLDKFYEYFGADAVLFTYIKSWDKSYMVLAASLTISIDAKLKSTRTNRVLWEYNGTIVADLSGQSSSGNPIIDLIAKAVVTGINAATADYVPYAQLANTMLLQTVPFGKYHALHDKDRQQQLVDQKPQSKSGPTTSDKSNGQAVESDRKPDANVDGAGDGQAKSDVSSEANLPTPTASDSAGKSIAPVSPETKSEGVIEAQVLAPKPAAQSDSSDQQNAQTVPAKAEPPVGAEKQPYRNLTPGLPAPAKT